MKTIGVVNNKSKVNKITFAIDAEGELFEVAR